MKIINPYLGPIVGHTTEQSAKIWIKGLTDCEKKANLSCNIRTIGIIAITHVDNRKIDNPELYFFRLHRADDRTGVFNLGVDIDLFGKQSQSLQHNTMYQVCTGVLIIDDPMPDDYSVGNTELSTFISKYEKKNLSKQIVYFFGNFLRKNKKNNLLQQLLNLDPQKSTATFKTFSQNSDQLSFIFGSCRYPGFFWKRKNADRIFGKIIDNIEQNNLSTQFFMMVGDQIYADMLHKNIPIGLADTHDEFQSRYIEAFGARNLRKLMQHVPTYMILDDHEIEDNWSQDRLAKSREKRKLFHLALNAYINYQDSHNPQNYNDRLFYNFCCHGYPLFVLDVRTQKYRNSDIANGMDNHMLGRPTIDCDHQNQLDILLHWLKDQQENSGNIPKFVVSSSVFVPSPINERTEIQSQKTFDHGDSWPAFPVTKRKILNFIIENEIKNVVFLSGDIHNANVAKMYFESDDQILQNKINNLNIYSIVSSAFYWPWSFADGNPSDFVHDSKMENQKDSFDVNKHITMNYNAWNFSQQNNFTHVTLDRHNHQIIVQNFDENGQLILFNQTNNLILEKW